MIKLQKKSPELKGRQNLYKLLWSHDQDGRHAHMIKPFKNLQNRKANDQGTWYVGLPRLL